MDTDSLRIDYAELLCEARGQILDWLKAVAEPIGNQMYEYTFEDETTWAGNCNVLSIRADKEHVVLFRDKGGHNDFTVFDIGMDGVLGFMEQLDDADDFNFDRVEKELSDMARSTATGTLDFDIPFDLGEWTRERIVGVKTSNLDYGVLYIIYESGAEETLAEWALGKGLWVAKTLLLWAKGQGVMTFPDYDFVHDYVVENGGYNLNKHNEFGALVIKLGDDDECPLFVEDIDTSDDYLKVVVSVKGTALEIDGNDTMTLQQGDLTEQNLEDIAKFFKSKSDVLPEGYGHDKELVRKINNAYRDHRENFEIIMYALAQKYDEATAEILLLNGFEQKDIAKNATDFLAKICDDTDLQIIIDFCSTIK